MKNLNYSKKKHSYLKTGVTFLALFLFTMSSQIGFAQTWSTSFEGTNLDRWIINKDLTETWSGIRLVASPSKAWNIFHEDDNLRWRYSTVADVLDLGTTKMTLNNNGYLGIGTENPSHKLHVEGGDIYFGAGHALTNNGTMNIVSDNDNTGDGIIHFKSGPDTTMIITDNGNIGIGTTNPIHKLHVDGGDIFLNYGYSLRNEGVLNIQSDDDDTGDGIIHFKSGSDTTMIITDNGNIGIGTTNPIHKLHVDGGDIYFGASHALTNNGTMNIVSDNDNTGDGIIHFKSGPDTQMTMLDNGNFGIGTDAPTEKLEVKGNVKADRVISDQVILNIGSFPDYVFEESYEMMTLSDLDTYIKNNKHLPKMPSEAEVIKNGADLGQINTVLVEKVEELTIYTIQQEKQLDALTKQLSIMQKQLTQLIGN